MKNIREIHLEVVTDAVEKLCISANYHLREDILNSLQHALGLEESGNGKNALVQLIHNAQIARDDEIAICQDTGMIVAFVEVGQDVHVFGGSITEAINEGVRRGYKKGSLRNSVVKDPLCRVNTLDNTPALVYYDIVEGSNIKITIMPKGFGSENISRVKMFRPFDGEAAVEDFVLEIVKNSGFNSCPPLIVGIGLGGTMEKAAMIAKKALLRPVNTRNDIEYVSRLEERLLNKINNLGIGPAGFGGCTTALSVNIEVFATHIAGFPVAVNISCNCTRHAECIL